MIINQFNITPKLVRSDNESEFMINQFYASKGIVNKKSCVETIQENGRVESKHQHVLHVGISLLY